MSTYTIVGYTDHSQRHRPYTETVTQIIGVDDGDELAYIDRQSTWAAG